MVVAERRVDAYYAEQRCVLVHPDGTGSKNVLKLKDGWFTTRHFAGRSPVWSPDNTQLLLNVVKNDERAVDIVLLDVASGRTTTKIQNGLSVFRLGPPSTVVARRLSLWGPLGTRRRIWRSWLATPVPPHP